ncbi:formimidoylglutamate deiminase [Neotabrizicola sp. sgz301269]|uniref:formimidoylglutamate deiminase n=1 Tax=Neotabrizicola sp. sgz301269 TaxID=3276282 RepID=UPI00376F8742
MREIFANWALLPEGWARDVVLTLDGAAIASVAAGPAPADATRVQALIPGMANLHSHAFQRGMAGLAETRGASADSFWTWREVMYRFALALNPEQMQAIAELAYIEMLEAGFTRVGEFHYLHHAPDGSSYADPAEMSLRILAAAQATGLHLTHLPVFYAHSDFGGAAPAPGQRRFLHSPDAFLRLLDTLDARMTRPLDRLGFAPHSLRAATEDEISTLLTARPNGPVHVHVAEQMREVEDCLKAHGQRPVERLLATLPVDARWCLIHATHLTEAERRDVAASGAVAGLCPVTEANLGDGLFPAPEFLSEGGAFGIGTDSNVRIALAEELQVLEYGQRLTRRQRNLLAGGPGSTGGALFRGALAGGAQALAAPPARIAAGAPADLVALHDETGPAPDGDLWLDRWLFGRGVAVETVWCGGVECVSGGRHRDRDRVVAGFRRAVEAIQA